MTSNIYLTTEDGKCITTYISNHKYYCRQVHYCVGDIQYRKGKYYPPNESMWRYCGSIQKILKYTYANRILKVKLYSSDRVIRVKAYYINDGVIMTPHSTIGGHYEKGRMVGVWKKYHPTTKSVMLEYRYNSKGEMEGMQMVCDEYGRITCMFNIKDNQKHGTSTILHYDSNNNNNMSRIAQFKGGLLSHYSEVYPGKQPFYSIHLVDSEYVTHGMFYCEDDIIIYDNGKMIEAMIKISEDTTTTRHITNIRDNIYKHLTKFSDREETIMTILTDKGEFILDGHNYTFFYASKIIYSSTYELGGWKSSYSISGTNYIDYTPLNVEDPFHFSVSNLPNYKSTVIGNIYNMFSLPNIISIEDCEEMKRI
jgi:hypothetical protein